MLPERKLIASLLLGVVVLSSCSSGEGPRPGVGVRSINTNVGLGIELEAAAPANIFVQPQRRPQLEEPRATIPPFEFEVPAPVDRPCALAGPFDFPEVEAGVEPDGRPAAGRFPWKLDGEVTTGGGVVEIDTFETRVIRNIRNHPSIPSAFTFEVEQENLYDQRQNRGTLTTRYRVTPRPFVEQEQVPNDAGKGLYLEAITFTGQDTQGQSVQTTFNPSPAIQLMAFPVQDGAEISSTGTDPATLAQLSVQGVVRGHKQVDACGDRVDTWFVDATYDYRFSDQNGRTQNLVANYDYGVATQYGGLIIFEHIDAPPDEPAVTIEARIGEVPKARGN